MTSELTVVYSHITKPDTDYNLKRAFAVIFQKICELYDKEKLDIEENQKYGKEILSNA